MTKMDFLTAYKDALAREKRLSEKILQLRERQASASAVRYTAMPRGTELKDLSDYIVELEDKIAALVDVRRRSDAVADVVCQVLARLPAEEGDVLYYKYIRGWGAQKIALQLPASRATVYRLEARAIEHLEINAADEEKIVNLIA